MYIYKMSQEVSLYLFSLVDHPDFKDTLAICTRSLVTSKHHPYSTYTLTQSQFIAAMSRAKELYGCSTFRHNRHLINFSVRLQARVARRRIINAYKKQSGHDDEW